MPILQFGELKTFEGRLLSLFRLVAVMGSPNDSIQQSEYLVTRAAKALAEERHAAYEEFFQEQGGLGAVAEARPFSVLSEVWYDRIDDWFVTSMMMNLLWRLSFEPHAVRDQCSVNKAAFIIERLREHGSPHALLAIPKNRNDIVKIWGRYRSVAHLCAAMVTASHQDEITNSFWLKTLDSLPYMLCAARYYQIWGLAQRLPRNARTVLTRPDLWEIPEDLDLPRTSIALAMLTPDEVQLLKTYRAPVPQH